MEKEIHKWKSIKKEEKSYRKKKNSKDASRRKRVRIGYSKSNTRQINNLRNF